jgi:Icc-related predicted phosphoesterase
MKINLVSDLHLEFGDCVLPGGDVLVLAGDIFLARDFKNETTRTAQYRRFIDKELSKYAKVIYVLGNHEHYHHKYLDTYDVLQVAMPDNVFMLENSMIEIEDVLFYGATLWSDFLKGDHFVMNFASQYMNDFRVIKNYSTVPYTTGKFTPHTALQVHKHSVNLLRGALSTCTPDAKVVVVTHHAPTFASVSQEFAGDHLNGAYASDLSNLILDNPVIKAWCHGHMHSTSDYMVGSTRVMANPRGYVGHSVNSDFDPSFSFEVK